jgi:hypothetical protein
MTTSSSPSCRLESCYRLGRTPDWLKFKNLRRPAGDQPYAIVAGSPDSRISDGMLTRLAKGS